MAHFIDCIETGETPLTDPVSSLEGLKVIWKLYDAEEKNEMVGGLMKVLERTVSLLESKEEKGRGGRAERSTASSSVAAATSGRQHTPTCWPVSSSSCWRVVAAPTRRSANGRVWASGKKPRHRLSSKATDRVATVAR